MGMREREKSDMHYLTTGSVRIQEILLILFLIL